ncbi:6-phosphogluconate dehydrogenase [Grosmannia clavigera kw1407]|uniref:6-phosphogluconate dehydrogenase n=1 Tax=Grosmannia clavigera (strain kw1407 / UAMH 11150) TaxID=655863 RepID=F0XRJ7_GROCL|nr:6-phosphogluconate dehydrogenase [Grosmannia clavigera kw1407]EFW99741.1 6-phosphogluconate dehydrogenase [Grosmannia clavigera kw1407]
MTDDALLPAPWTRNFMTFFALQRRAVTAFAPQFKRLLSSTRVVRAGSFTLVVPATSSKESVLGQLKSRDASSDDTDNAAVVLASPDLSSWLEDEAFMSSLLQRLPLSRSTQGNPGVSVLSAVVDGLAVSRTGLSVLHGCSDTLLPRLWRSSNKEGAAVSRRGGRNSIYGTADVEAAITVELPLMHTADDSTTATPSSCLRVTVPLANTLFQNGRRSTLLASRWSWTRTPDDGGSFTLQHMLVEEREHEVVVPLAGPASSTSQTVIPLFAATEPRTIAAGLGNIVRQIVLGKGKPSPASHELESAIPALLATRRQAWPGADFDAETGRGPLGVWGLVVPPDAQELYASLQETLMPIADHSVEAEQHAAAMAGPSLAALLAAGCRLHRILSGGGGWGQKQGLLSLDPQMAHPASVSANMSTDNNNDDDDDDAAMASFMRSLRGETEAQSGDNLATPGALLQFLVAPLTAVESNDSNAVIDSRGSTPSIAFGAHPGYEDAKQDGQPAAVAFISGHFGAVSNQGVFLAGSPSKEGAGPKPNTKLDPLAKIGILSVGDMGVGIARLLIASGFSVATNCTGRSQMTVDRARAAHVDLLSSDEELVRQSDVILSVVPPRDAIGTAERIARALKGVNRPADRPLYYADMNAVSPSTARRISALLPAAVRPIDGCILGGPPRAGGDGEPWYVPRMPTSGPYGFDDVFPSLAATLHSRHVGPDMGAASGLKMCYASMTKGYAAIAVQAFTTAQQLHILPDLQWALAAAGTRQRTEAALTGMPPKAYRWAGEMEEISATFADDGGFAPTLFQGAAEVFRTVADDTVLGQEKVGARQRGQTAEDVTVAM